MLLLAGTGMVKETWLLAWVPMLIGAGYQVVIMDHRGVGESDAPEAPYTIEEMATDTAGVVEHLGIGPCLLIGCSLGGMVAEQLLVDHPELVRAAALVSAARPLTAFGRLYARGQAEAAAAGIDLPESVAVPMLLGLILTPQQLQDDELVQPYFDRLAAAPPWRGPGRLGQFSANLDAELDGAYRSRRPRISRPVLVVAYTDDVVLPPCSAVAMVTTIPGAELAVIDGAAHGGILTRPAESTKVITDFFAPHV